MMISGISPLGGLLQGGASTATRGAGAAADLGASFGAALANAAERTVETLQGAEKLSITAMQGGEVPMREVVDAVMSAEQALQTSIAIRDKIVTAYLEISRMAI